jgi:hypothetical protein
MQRPAQQLGITSPKVLQMVEELLIRSESKREDKGDTDTGPSHSSAEVDDTVWGGMRQLRERTGGSKQLIMILTTTIQIDDIQ